jgi:hypothetical protein
MCIAIANYKNNPLSDQQLTNCWENNPNGAGILYKENGKLTLYKQLDDMEAFKREYTRVIKLSNCLVHFRVKSAGAINLDNVHPFMVHQNLGFIHNGTISKLSFHGQDKSDTQVLNDTFLKNLSPDFVNNLAIMELLENYVGFSKLVFMDETEVFTIINESKGSYDGLNWYSNDSYKRVNNYYYAGNKKVAKTGVSTNVSTPVPPDTVKIPLQQYDDQAYKDWCKGYYGYLDDEPDESLFLPEDEDLVEDHPMEDEWADFIDEICFILDQVTPEVMSRGIEDEIGNAIIFAEDQDTDGVFNYTTVNRELQKQCESFGYPTTLTAALSFYVLEDTK